LLKLKDVPQEQMGEVVRIASEMYDREHAQKQERASTVAAAEELGLPQEYLERAAKELQEKRIAEARLKREKRQRIIIGSVVAAGVLGGAALIFRPAPAPLTLSPAAVQPVGRISENTVAEVGVNGGAYTLRVEKFNPDSKGDYFANLNVPVNTSLAGYRTMTFTVRGEGIPTVRTFFENGPERWRASQDVTVTPSGQRVTINLNNSTRQINNGQWSNTGRSKPGQVENISFKVGEKINSPDVSGTVEISDIQFK
jgi:hypothetical protein